MVLRKTLFKLNDALGEHAPDFYCWLDRYDDFAGKRLIDHVEDITNADESDPLTHEILKETEKKIHERIEVFCKEKGIDRCEQFLKTKSMQSEL